MPVPVPIASSLQEFNGNPVMQIGK